MSEGVYRAEYVQALALLAKASTMVRSGGGPVPVLVGGAVVEFDTASQIVSGDFDFVSADEKPFVEALVKLGFERSDGLASRTGALLHPVLGIGVEFVSGAYFDGKADKGRIRLVRQLSPLQSTAPDRIWAMAADLQNPIFHDETKAREWLEARVWAGGRSCPHCGAEEARTRRLEGKAHRPGLYQCNACREQFTATVGTVMERSKVPLPKWLMAIYLLSASKKGMSAHQLSRMLGVSYKSTWFMMHRVREAMREPSFAAGPLGGANQVVEADETYVGGKAKNRKGKVPPKEAVVALVEREGRVRGFHVANVRADTLRPVLVEQVNAASYLMTDESTVYPKAVAGFGGHGAVNHSIEEYVRGGFWHTNTVENYFSLLKRGITGVYHHVSAAHLKRYVGEFDFRYNTRKRTDMERAALAAEGIKGKRLTYRRAGEAADARA